MRHSQQIFRSIQMAVLCVVSGAVISVGPLAAQTLFEWPVTGVDVTRYRTIEECISAINRVRDSLQRSSDIWADTLPLRRNDTSDVFTAAQMIQTAQRCVGQFDIHTTPIDTWQLMLSGLLSANRGSAADSLVDRRIALIIGTDSTVTWEHGAVLDSVIGIYLKVRPIRFSVIKQRIHEWVALRGVNTLAQSWRLTDVFDSAWVTGQSEMATWSATQVVRISEQAVDRCAGQEGCIGGFRRRYQKALDLLSYSVLLDSLQRSTAAYTRILQDNWIKAGRHATREPIPGKHAPPIHGDFWFDLRPQTDTVPVPLTTPPQRPSPGAVSLVVWLTRVCNTDIEGFVGGRLPGSGCIKEYAVLRRLAARFPKLSITIVVQTTGFFGRLEPLAPAAEAAMYARWWLGYHRIPAMLAVTNTAFWRVEDPDRRRQNEQTSNQIAYANYVRNGPGRGSFLLLDREGVVVESYPQLEDGTEQDMEEKIDVLMKR